MATTLHTKQNTPYILNNISASGQFLTAGTISIADSILTAKSNPNSLEVKGKVVINGQDLEERLKTIEKVLHIPERDAILEAKHPKLKELYDQYIHALGKYRTWESIKGNDYE